MKTRIALLPALLGAGFVATPASANLASLTSAVDFSTVLTSLVAIAAVLIGVLVIRKGIRFVLGMVK